MSDEVPRPSVPLSLKARENASRNLKRIFDHINASVREQQPSALPSLLHFLPTMDGSVGTSKLSADSPDCSKQPSHVPGSCQETRDFLSLHSYDAESYVEEEAFSEGSTKASPQRSIDTNLSSRPSTCALWKAEPKDSSRFGSNWRESVSVQNGRSNSSDPRRVDRVNSNQQDQALPIDQFKEGAGFAFPKAAFVQEEGNRRSLRSASPASSFMDHQQGDSTFHPEWCGNGLWGTAETASRSVSSSAARKQPTAQMTIFYSGVVNVYDNVPTEKANAIMLLAGSGNPWSSYLNGAPSMAVASSATATPVATSAAKIVVPVTREPIAPFTASLATSTSTPLSTFPAPMKQVVHQRSHAELPFARKVSLARFFERRRERVQAKATANSVETAGVDEEISGIPEPQAKRFCTRSSSPSPSGNSR